jgi:hypothetical protein
MYMDKGQGKNKCSRDSVAPQNSHRFVHVHYFFFTLSVVRNIFFTKDSLKTKKTCTNHLTLYVVSFKWKLKQSSLSFCHLINILIIRKHLNSNKSSLSKDFFHKFTLGESPRE